MWLFGNIIYTDFQILINEKTSRDKNQQNSKLNWGKIFRKIAVRYNIL